MRGWRPVWIRITAISIAAVLVGPGQGQERPLPVAAARLSFNIAAQPLGDALKELGEQSGLTIVMDSAVGRTVVTTKLAGVYTTAEALRRLLASTGLRAEFLDVHTVAVLAPTAVVRPPDSAEHVRESSKVSDKKPDSPTAPDL